MCLCLLKISVADLCIGFCGICTFSCSILFSIVLVICSVNLGSKGKLCMYLFDVDWLLLGSACFSVFSMVVLIILSMYSFGYEFIFKIYFAFSKISVW